MRVLMLHKGGLNGVRGTEICVIQAAEAFHAQGYELAFARNLPVIDEPMRQFTQEIIEINAQDLFIDGFKTKLPLISYLKCYWQIRNLVKTFKPDLIYVSGGMLCQFAVPIAKLARIPVLCHFHHPTAKRYYVQWLIQYADRHIVPSEFTASNMREKIQVDPKIIYNGIDCDQIKPLSSYDAHLRNQYGINTDTIVIGQVGALVPNKRPLFLLKAFALAAKQNEKLHLCLVGRGPLAEELKAEIKKQSLEHKVTLTGYVDSVIPYYQELLDINTLASMDEGLGISVLEGAAAGLPAIITDCTGLSETVIHDRTGIKVSLEATAEKFAEAILQLAHSKSKIQQMGIAARKNVIEHFNLKDYQANLVKETQDLVNQYGSKH